MSRGIDPAHTPLCRAPGDNNHGVDDELPVRGTTWPDFIPRAGRRLPFSINGVMTAGFDAATAPPSSLPQLTPTTQRRMSVVNSSGAIGILAKNFHRKLMPIRRA